MRGLNLLPWREQLREERKKDFFIFLGASTIFAILIIIFIHTIIAGSITQQRDINRHLQVEINKINKQIIEIKGLKKKKAEMLNRMALIQALQASRPLTVKFYDEIVRVVPPGVFLISVTRKKNNIVVIGKAESNSRISQMMRHIQASRWLAAPVLSEIKTDVNDQRYQRDFTMKLQLKGLTQKKGIS